MHRTVRPLAAATTACLCLVVAATGATADEGFYVGLGAGLSIMKDAGVKGHASELYSPPMDATSEVDRGGAFSGAVGYRFANGLRVEGELGYRENDLKELTVREPGSLAALLPLPLRQAPAALDRLRGTRSIEGDISALSFMANLYYDFDLDFGLRPYVGGGVGLTRLSLSAETSGRKVVDGTDTVFAYQIGAGVGYGIGGTDGRPVVVSLDYRVYGTADPTFEGSLTGTPFDTEVRGSYVGVGLRFGL